MPKKLLWRISAFGALAGLLTLLTIAVLFRLEPYGWIAAVFISAVGGATLTMVGAQWYGDSIVDSGTGLYNRRYLFRRLDLELAKARESKQPVGLAVIDVDDFRQYNNQYGHLVGDEILRAVAKTIQASVQKNDVVGRWGGEEFALILPGANIHEALAITENVRQKVKELIVDLDELTIKNITISGGVSDCNAQSLDTIGIVERADKAMYTAKKEKNKVIPFIEDDPRFISMLGVPYGRGT